MHSRLKLNHCIKKVKASPVKTISIRLFLLAGFLFQLFSLNAQDSERSIQVKYINDQTQLDGVLDEAAWLIFN